MWVACRAFIAIGSKISVPALSAISFFCFLASESPLLRPSRLTSMQPSSTSLAAAAARAEDARLSLARGLSSAPAPFSSSSQSLLYTCQQCHKTAPLDASAPVSEATIKAFEEAFFKQQASTGGASGVTGGANSSSNEERGRSNSLQAQQQQAQQQSAMDLLSESFVVLPASRSAQSVAPPSSASSAAAAAASASSPSSVAAGRLGTTGAGGTAGPLAPGANAAVPSAANFHKQVESASRVLEIVSARCPVAQPLCTHCAHTIFGDLERKLQEIERDREEYAEAIRQLEAAAAAAAAGASSAAATDSAATAAVASSSSAGLSEADRIAREEAAEDEALAAEEAALQSRLSELGMERESLREEYGALTAESQRLSELESGFWREYEEYALSLAQLTAEQNHLRSQIRTASDTLDRLKRTNVFDDAFHISYDGHFATINGFRLGRLPAQPVDWPETSAALGQVLLLLATMARHSGYKFLKYRLMPMGSYSKMAKLDDLSTTYELYGSNDLILGRLFWYRRFDTALVWLLACIQEFAEFAQKTDKNFAIKYPSVQHTQRNTSGHMQSRVRK